MSFFICINRRILWEGLRCFIERHYNQSDKKLILEVARKIVENEPTSNCFIKGKRRDWQDFPKDKSLFYSRPHCGLPIGNLTSQVFANFYLNSFDHYIKHDLGVRFYGRYVDDFILVHEDKALLKSLIPQMEQFYRKSSNLRFIRANDTCSIIAKALPFLG